MGDVLSALAITALCIGSWLALFLCVPRWLTSMFRYDLWRLHDDLVDALRDGSLSRSDAAIDLLRCIETAIMNARDFTFARVLGLHAIAATAGAAPDDGPSYAELPPDERHVLHDFESRLVVTVVHHVKAGSPSGWFAACVRPVALFGYHLARLVGASRRRPTLVVVDAVREELAVTAGLPLDMRNLSACV